MPVNFSGSALRVVRLSGPRQGIAVCTVRTGRWPVLQCKKLPKPGPASRRVAEGSSSRASGQVRLEGFNLSLGHSRHLSSKHITPPTNQPMLTARTTRSHPGEWH